jgi:hypothetical protein
VTREDELEALAQSNGWAFSIEDHDDLATLPFRFFTNGVAGVAMDTIEGERDSRDFVAFDYEWSSLSSGMLETESTLDSSCAITALPAVCPELMVSHETSAHWIAHPTKHHVFESERPEFARAFRVTTTHPEFAAAVFDEAMERWFLDELPDRDLCFEIGGSWSMCFTRRRDPKDVPMVIDAAIAFERHIPAAAYDGLHTPTA